MDYSQIAEIISGGGVTSLVMIMYIVDIRAMKKKVEENNNKLDRILDTCKKTEQITLKDLLPLLDKGTSKNDQDE